MTARLSAESIRKPPGAAELTPRERGILDFVVRGVASREAAQALGISTRTRTVEAHRRHILRKPGRGM